VKNTALQTQTDHRQYACAMSDSHAATVAKEEVEKKKKEMEVESAKLKVVQEEQDHQSVWLMS